MEACREGGYQVSVVIVDRSGIVQVMLRDQLAEPHTLDAARRKARREAWMAASFDPDTSAFLEVTSSESRNAPSRSASEAIMGAGGAPLYGEGVLIGAVGVSGTRSAAANQKCAEKGADALAEKSLF